MVAIFVLADGCNAYGSFYDSVTFKSWNWKRLLDFLPFIQKEIDALKQMQALPPPDNPEQSAAMECCNAVANNLIAEGRLVHPPLHT